MLFGQQHMQATATQGILHQTTQQPLCAACTSTTVTSMKMHAVTRCHWGKRMDTPAAEVPWQVNTLWRTITLHTVRDRQCV